RHVPERPCQTLTDVGGRPVEVAREHRRRQPELPLVDARVQTVQRVVATEKRLAVLLRNDVRPLARGEEGAKPERMVGMPMRVDGDRERRVTPGADRLAEPLA